MGHHSYYKCCEAQKMSLKFPSMHCFIFSSIPTPVFLPGKIPRTEEPGGPQSTGSQRVGHNWATEHAGASGYLWDRHHLRTLVSFSCLAHGSTHDSLNIRSVQFSHSVMSDSLGPHELQHTRPPRPSPTPKVYPNSSPLSWWCHPTISSSVVPFSSHVQSFPALGSFQMS